jgi:hypothetical protein
VPFEPFALPFPGMMPPGRPPRTPPPESRGEP